MTFGCGSHGQAQRMLQGGRWWIPPSPSHVEFCESMFACGLSMHQKCSNYAPSNSKSAQKHYELGSMPNSSFFHCRHLRLTFESIKELGNVSYTRNWIGWATIFARGIGVGCLRKWVSHVTSRFWTNWPTFTQNVAINHTNNKFFLPQIHIFTLIVK